MIRKQHTIIILFLTAVAIFIGTGSTAILFSGRIIHENTKIGLVSKAYEIIEEIRITLRSAIISQRNYIITSDTEYYHDFVRQKEHLIGELEKFNHTEYSDSIGTTRIALLDSLISQKIEMLGYMIEIDNKNGTGKVADLIEENSTPVFEAIQEQATEIETTLEKTTENFRSYSQKSARITNLAIYSGYSVAFILLFICFFILRHQIIQRSKAERDLKIQARELAEINAEKDRLLSIIAHDIKNPFVALLNLMDLLEEPMQAGNIEKIREIIGLVNASSKKTYDLLQNLLDWSRIQLGRLIPEPSVADACELVQKNLELMSETTAQKKIVLTLAHQKNNYVFVDSNMILTVLRNIISNALKFTPEKGAIHIDFTSSGNELIISVADTGCGIREENLPFLFDRIASTSKFGDSRNRGTGLGLLLAKELVEKNNGRIWATSEYGKGSIFYIALPKALPV